MTLVAAPSTVSVVICAYTERRWSDLVAAVESVAAQSRRPDEIIVVVDHNEALRQRAVALLPQAVVLPNEFEQGLSGGRNTAIAHATGAAIAFLDDDAVAAPDWLATLLDPFTSAHVAVVGGSARPDWDGGRPVWFPEEFDWVVGCTHRGVPETRTEVRNVIGCNMAFRRSVLAARGSFRTGLGRVGTLPVGCEETELCIRIRQADPDARVILEPAAGVRHHVTHERRTVRYFLARNYSEGRSKAMVAALVGSSDAMATERAYAGRVLPAAVGRGLAGPLRGDFGGPLRSLAVVGGLGAFAIGYARAEISRRASTKRRAAS